MYIEAILTNETTDFLKKQTKKKKKNSIDSLSCFLLLTVGERHLFDSTSGVNVTG